MTVADSQVDKAVEIGDFPRMENLEWALVICQAWNTELIAVSRAVVATRWGMKVEVASLDMAVRDTVGYTDDS